MKNLVEKINSELSLIDFRIKAAKTATETREALIAKTAIVFFAARLLDCKTVGELKNHGVEKYL